MKKFLLSTAVLAVLGLAGCAVDPNYANSYPKVAADRDAEPITGTRLPKPTTEKLVKAVGNKDYKDEQPKSIHNDGPKGAN